MPLLPFGSSSADKVKKTGDTMTGDLNVPDEAYGAGWNGSTEVPTKNAVYDKIFSLPIGGYDTEANILALTPTAGLVYLGYTDDSKHWVYIGSGSSWYQFPFEIVSTNANPNVGISQLDNKTGYFLDFITNKGLYNVFFGSSPSTTEGGVWVDSTVTPKQYKIYLNSQTNTIIIDFSISTGKLTHTPFVSTQTVNVWSGMSNDVGLNGLPMINEYDIPVGCCGGIKIIDGGSA